MTRLVQNRWLIFGIPLLLFALVALIPHTFFYQTQNQNLSLALSIDLLVTIPFVYFLLIRKQQNIPNYTVASVAVLCLIASAYIIPQQDQFFLEKVRTFIIPTIELSILTFIILKTRRVVKRFKTHRNIDFYSAVLIACKESFPKHLAHVLATEIAVMYYAFSKKSKNATSANHFTYFKKNGIRTA